MDVMKGAGKETAVEELLAAVSIPAHTGRF